MDAEAGDKPSPRADLVSGGVWIAIGTAIAIGSWRMDRLESQGVPWFTAPGLLPGIVGVGIVLFALLIVVRALRAPAPAGGQQTSDVGRALLSIALCLGFAAALVGHGLPFMAAAAIYLFLHIFILQYPERRAAGEIARGAFVALAIAVTAAVAISLVFQEIFLVRLP